jgi:hypothetical protein
MSMGVCPYVANMVSQWLASDTSVSHIMETKRSNRVNVRSEILTHMRIIKSASGTNSLDQS